MRAGGGRRCWLRRFNGPLEGRAVKNKTHDDNKKAENDRFDEENKNLAVGIFIVYPFLFALLGVIGLMMLPWQWRWWLPDFGNGPSNALMYMLIGSGGGCVVGLLVATYIVLRY